MYRDRDAHPPRQDRPLSRGMGRWRSLRSLTVSGECSTIRFDEVGELADARRAGAGLASPKLRRMPSRTRCGVHSRTTRFERERLAGADRGPISVRSRAVGSVFAACSAPSRTRPAAAAVSRLCLMTRTTAAGRPRASRPSACARWPAPVPADLVVADRRRVGTGKR